MKTMTTLALSLTCAAAGLAQVSAPKGTTWADSLDAGKKEAAKRGCPILMFSFDKVSDDCTRLKQNFEDPKVVAVCKVFACVFVSRDLDLNKFQMSYVGWMADSAGAQYTPPLVVFGDAKGNCRKEFRLEAKCPSPEELLEHLLKVLQAVTPERVENARYEMLMLSTLPELAQSLCDSLDKLAEKLTSDQVNPFQEELKNASLKARAMEVKLEGLKDTKEKKFKSDAKKHYGALKKFMDKLAGFKGKTIDTFKGHLDKCKEGAAEIKKIADEAKE
jgi:hypothetical protein